MDYFLDIQNKAEAVKNKKPSHWNWEDFDKKQYDFKCKMCCYTLISSNSHGAEWAIKVAYLR